MSVEALQQAGFDVIGSDITQGVDFLGQAPETGVNAIITNPVLWRGSSSNAPCALTTLA